MLQHFSDICEEANDRCKELRAVKKKLVNGLQSVPLLICHSDYLPTFISENLKVMDMTAAAMCREYGLTAIAIGKDEKNGVIRVLKGEKLGTTMK